MQRLLRILILILSINVCSNFNSYSEKDEEKQKNLNQLTLLQNDFLNLCKLIKSKLTRETLGKIKKLPETTKKKIVDAASKITLENSKNVAGKISSESLKLAMEHREISLNTIIALMLITALKKELKEIVGWPINIATLPIEVFYGLLSLILQDIKLNTDRFALICQYLFYPKRMT